MQMVYFYTYKLNKNIVFKLANVKYFRVRKDSRSCKIVTFKNGRGDTDHKSGEEI